MPGLVRPSRPEAYRQSAGSAVRGGSPVRRVYVGGMNDSLADEIVSELRHQGGTRTRPGEPTADWRTAARAAARASCRLIETIEHDGIAYAALRDWPAINLEREVNRKALRPAVTAAAQ